MKHLNINFEVKGKFKTEEVTPIPELIEGSWTPPCNLFLDQATNTGYAVFDSKGCLITGGAFLKEDLGLQEYKFALKEEIEKLIEKFDVKNVFYEEVFDGGNISTTEILLYIKHMVQDLTYNREDLEVFGLDNKSWKSKLALPDIFKAEKNKEKELVLHYVLQVYPLLLLGTDFSDIKSHMVDAIGMGIAITIKSGATARTNFYSTVRFNKKLPIHQVLVQKNDTDDWETIIKKLRKPFKTAYEVGDIFEVELNTRKNTDDLIRQILTHKDTLTIMKIPYTYKNWGIMLLENNIKPSDVLSEDKSFWIVSVRKNRK